MALRYVALGDSYTIGTSVDPVDRWPDRLVAALGAGPDGSSCLELVANLAVNGWTSGDVIRAQLPRLDGLRPDFVTVLVGVNDVVQGVPEDRYRANLATILDELLARLPAGRIVTVTTPDYTVMPAGADFGDPNEAQAGIVASTLHLSSSRRERGVPVVDVFDLSERAAGDQRLVASDGLHPSGAQYALWVERIAPVVRARLAGEVG